MEQRDAKGMIHQSTTPNPSNAPSPSVDEARLRQQAIGVKLRQMFDEVVNEPIPDDFLDILRDAEKPASDQNG